MVAWIGRRASLASRDYTTNVKSASEEQARAKIRAHALKAHAEKPFDTIVSGHVHVSEDSRPGAFRCVNTGTWLKEPLVFDLQDGEGRLIPVEKFLQG
jgi:UDP-2,3-diacylglucosamine hydrolase